MKSFRVPKTGALVAVRWLDSGADCHEEPGAPGVGLCYRVTHGRLVGVRRDERVHREMCSSAPSARCRCDVLEVIMCHSDEGPSTVGAVWVEAICSITVLHK